MDKQNIDDLYTKFKIQEYNRGEVSITGYLFLIYMVHT